jgi:malate/lactate dehydrogenase
VKVTLLGGAGGVGASVVFNLALAGRDDELVVVDNRPQMVTSHLMDLDQVLGSPGAGAQARTTGASRTSSCCPAPLRSASRSTSGVKNA